MNPIDMLLFCPECHAQHIDAPDASAGWLNPPHKSHKCGRCGLVWRPADVPTNGVPHVRTRGAADTWDRFDLLDAKAVCDDVGAWLAARVPGLKVLAVGASWLNSWGPKAGEVVVYYTGPLPAVAVPPDVSRYLPVTFVMPLRSRSHTDDEPGAVPNG